MNNNLKLNENCSYIVYNVITYNIKECIYNPSEQNFNKLIEHFESHFENGDMIFKINKDFRDLNEINIQLECINSIFYNLNNWKDYLTNVKQQMEKASKISKGDCFEL